LGVEIRVEGLTKRFGKQTIWEDVTMTIPEGEISVLLGPSGTGKSVFLKTLVGLLRPNAGHIWIEGKDLPALNEHDLYEVRKLFGVLFQDGALFGSMSLYDNIAFPLREHTKKTEGEIKSIVMEKMEMVGLLGAEKKLPGEISGGMRKRAGLARGLVLDPQILLFDEPDSGLDPVRTAYLNQLIVDLNAQIEATFLIVTHDINTARTVPDNIGLLFRRQLVMFGPRMQLLTSDEPVVRQFLNGRKEGPIGMAEEKDAAALAAEQQGGAPPAELPPIEKQLSPSNGQVRRTQRGSDDGSHAGNGGRPATRQQQQKDSGEGSVRVVDGKRGDKRSGKSSGKSKNEDEITTSPKELEGDLIEPTEDERPGQQHASAGGRRSEQEGSTGTAPLTGAAVDSDDMKTVSQAQSSASHPAKKTSTKKTAAKKTSRATAKKTTAKKTAAKTSTTKKTTAKKTTRRKATTRRQTSGGASGGDG
jgi:phospholipid/cholesterol/gamma-HCH transport system ATP-binding protein